MEVQEGEDPYPHEEGDLWSDMCEMLDRLSDYRLDALEAVDREGEHGDLREVVIAAICTACRKMLERLDEVLEAHDRLDDPLMILLPAAMKLPNSLETMYLYYKYLDAATASLDVISPFADTLRGQAEAEEPTPDTVLTGQGAEELKRELQSVKEACLADVNRRIELLTARERRYTKSGPEDLAIEARGARRALVFLRDEFMEHWGLT